MRLKEMSPCGEPNQPTLLINVDFGIDIQFGEMDRLAGNPRKILYDQSFGRTPLFQTLLALASLSFTLMSRGVLRPLYLPRPVCNCTCRQAFWCAPQLLTSAMNISCSHVRWFSPVSAQLPFLLALCFSTPEF